MCFFCTYWLYKYIVVYVIKSGVYKTELGKKVPQNNQRNRSCCKATHKTNYYIQVPNYKFMFCTCPICCILLLCFGSCSSYHYMFSSSPSGKKSLKKKAVLLVELAGEALPTRKEANNKDDQRCILWSSCALS